MNTNTPAKATPLLTIEGLKGGYGRVEVLRGVDLHVHAGETVALLGSNGAGKTTLNNVMCGIYRAWSGKVLFEGIDLTGAHYTDVVKAGLIQVPEGRKIFPNLSVIENLALGSFARARERRDENIEKVFATFPRLKERGDQLAGTMSGGEQQRVAIARAVAKNPQILLCDEPTGALDYETGIQILKVLKDVNIKYKNTVIVITHNASIANMADKIIKMRSGKITDVIINSDPVSAERIEW